MIQITPQMRILLAVEPVDFRKGIDGLVGVCKNVLDSDPFCGYVFVFVNRKRTAIKILVYDSQGFWLCQKRFSTGRFCWWPDKRQCPLMRLLVPELQLLIWNGKTMGISVNLPDMNIKADGIKLLLAIKLMEEGTISLVWVYGVENTDF